MPTISLYADAIAHYSVRLDTAGVDRDRLLLELIYRQDGKGDGKPCGDGWISKRKKCSKKSLKRLTAALKAGDKGAIARVRSGKKKASDRAKLKRAVEADRGKKVRDIKPKPESTSPAMKAALAKKAKKEETQRKKAERRAKNYKLMLQREDQIRLNDFETMHIYSPGTMKKKITIPGDKYEVAVPKEHESKLKNAIVTHNHPRGWEYSESDPRHAGNSFSNGDVMAAAFHNVQEMRAIAVGHRYSLKRPKEGWGNWRDVKGVLEEAEKDARAMIQGKIQTIMERDGEVAAEAFLPFAEAMHHDEKMKIFSKMYGATYTKEPWKPQT